MYTDQAVIDREIEHIFEKTSVYCGHESKVPDTGDYYTLQIGRQPMFMIRDRTGGINVLFNRCPQRGIQLCGAVKGNAGTSLACGYHGWRFHLDGAIEAIPMDSAYDGTRMTKDNPDCSVKPAARVESCRDFVFASLNPRGPDLLEFLGEAKVAFDDIWDRSPEGEVEAVPVCHRVVQNSNWKFFMENQLDALHPSVTHQSTGIAATRVEKRLT